MKRKLISILALLLMAVTGATAATIVTWNSSNASNLNLNNKSETIDGITIKSNEDRVMCQYYSNVFYFETNNTGGFTFTNTLGKNFTKIEMIGAGSKWGSAALGSGWSYSSSKATWTGDAASVDLLTSCDEFYASASSIVFTLSDTPVTGVTLSPTTSSLTAGGEALELTPTVAPEGATDKTVKWSVVQEGSIVALYTDQACTQAVGTDAIAAAKVYVKPLAAGQATVTVASNADASLKATCTVTVAATEPTYNVTFKEGTDDVGNWTIDPASAKQGQTVTVKYNGTKKVKSVKAVKKAAAPASKTIDLSTVTADVTAENGDVLTGTLGANVKISIADKATVTLDGVTINGVNDGNCKWAGITCAGDATIILSGTNTVKGFHQYYPGIYVPENKTMTIQEDGSLDASSNGMGAGIGGGYEIACGNITIKGGTINATGGSYAAGIGGGYGVACGNITIEGGNITATGGRFAVGIGGGTYGSCGNITITTGVTSVTATKGEYADNSIGADDEDSCGSVTIEAGANVTQN